MNETTNIADKLTEGSALSKEEFRLLIENYRGGALYARLKAAANKKKEEIFGNTVYIRALVEVSSYCANDCYYCGLRRSNTLAERYRLTKDEIIESCRIGYEAGFLTFVLQGGEDAFLTDDFLVPLIKELKQKFPDCAVTLSLGERAKASYEKLKAAGADRYLLRHETANAEHYAKLHPRSQSLENRLRCLTDLREAGYQVGSGFMVGSPFQTPECLAEDMVFLQSFRPEMIGIGPFIPPKDTPFGKESAGSVELTLFMLCLLRLTLPKVLLPATTALGTLNGREEGLMCGANVVMLNCSPKEVRKKYNIYDNKRITGEEAVEGLKAFRATLQKLGLTAPPQRGDSPNFI